MAPETFDYVVVGAGTAGCVVANRLTADGDTTVLLLEAGDEDRNPWIRIPLGTGKVFNDRRINWNYESEPCPDLRGRVLYQPRGKVLGGTGSINGMIYCRGNAADYDGWAAAGCGGWSYADVLPFFKQAEDQARGADDYHGVGGPLGVSGPIYRHPIADAMIAAAGEMGHPANPDFNGRTQDGAGYFQFTIRRGRRVSPASAYLHPVRHRRNLAVRTRSLAEHVVIEAGRATGVRYRRDGVRREVRARKEVVLCGGAFNSPQLLQLSGIGPSGLLQDLGIDVVRDCAKVGANYQDHFGMRMAFRSKRAVTLNDEVGSWWRKARMGLRYLVSRSGPMAAPGLPAGLFARSSPALPAPDVEFVLSLWTMVQGERNKARVVDPFSAFGMVLEDVQPDGRGRVEIRSADAGDPPRIHCRFLATDRDCRALIFAVRETRRIFAARAMAGFTGEELLPGPGVVSDEQIIDFARDNAFGLYHPAGTCAMGPSSDDVVDPLLRVRGVDALRVVDASVMPRITRGNINATVAMIAERGAALILAKA